VSTPRGGSNLRTNRARRSAPRGNPAQNRAPRDTRRGQREAAWPTFSDAKCNEVRRNAAAWRGRGHGPRRWRSKSSMSTTRGV